MPARQASTQTTRAATPAFHLPYAAHYKNFEDFKTPSLSPIEDIHHFVLTAGFDTSAFTSADTRLSLSAVEIISVWKLLM